MLEEWDECDEWERLVLDWPALWSNCIRQNIRSEGTSSKAYGGLVMTYLEEKKRDGSALTFRVGNGYLQLF